MIKEGKWVLILTKQTEQLEKVMHTRWRVLHCYLLLLTRLLFSSLPPNLSYVIFWTVPPNSKPWVVTFGPLVNISEVTLWVVPPWNLNPSKNPKLEFWCIMVTVTTKAMKNITKNILRLMGFGPIWSIAASIGES